MGLPCVETATGAFSLRAVQLCIPARSIAEQGASQSVRNCAFHLGSPVVILPELARESSSPICVLISSRIPCSLQGAAKYHGCREAWQDPCSAMPAVLCPLSPCNITNMTSLVTTHTVPVIESGVPNSGAEIALVCRCLRETEGGLARRWRGSSASRAAEKGLDLLERRAGVRPNVQRFCVRGAADKLTTVLGIPTLRLSIWTQPVSESLRRNGAADDETRPGVGLLCRYVSIWLYLSI